MLSHDDGFTSTYCCNETVMIKEIAMRGQQLRVPHRPVKTNIDLDIHHNKQILCCKPLQWVKEQPKKIHQKSPLGKCVFDQKFKMDAVELFLCDST